MNGSETRVYLSKSAVLLAISISLNFALAVTAILVFTKPEATTVGAGAQLSLLTIRTRLVTSFDSPAEFVYVTNRFRWRQLESANYEEYVGNLRAIGCPEKTVRDIILADVEDYYRKRRAALQLNQHFWLAGKRRSASEKPLEEGLDDLDREQRALIRRLLSVEWAGVSYRRFYLHDPDIRSQAESRLIFGPMTEETYQCAMQVFDKYQYLGDEAGSRWQKFKTDAQEAECRAEYKKLTQALKQDLAGVLSPSQVQELIARATASYYRVGGNFAVEAVRLTPAEARQIALARAGDACLASLLDYPQTDEERRLNGANFIEKVVALLGENRFAEFQRAQDYGYRQLLDLGNRNNLPKETAIQIYDLRQLAEKEFERIRKDASLDATARQQQFTDLKNELQNTVSNAVGEKAYQEYLGGREQAGAWLTNLTKL
jgi:hypothetical protein